MKLVYIVLAAVCAAVIGFVSLSFNKTAEAYDSCGGGNGQSKHAQKLSGSGPTHCKTDVCHTINATSSYWFMDPFTGIVTSFSYKIVPSNGAGYASCPNEVESRWVSP